MSNPYVGEIRMFAGNFAPAGWSFCEGQTLPISENETLFNLIGTSYGGDGQATFNLPDLRGRLPLHAGSGYVLAQSAGTESVTITSGTMPAHNHAMLANGTTANASTPANNVIGQSSKVDMFTDINPTQLMNPGMVTQTGGSQPHDNIMPYLCVNFIISLFGIFPHQ